MAPAVVERKRGKTSASALNLKNSSRKRKVDDAHDEDVDDQTAALLKGFESVDEDSDDGAAGEGFQTGNDVPEIPNDRKLRRNLKGTKDQTAGKPGVVYVGRIPHGFYEHEMRAYFAQFGDITRLRLSRNRKTGRSKHYAFIEFADAEVAQIVADTMNNYLLFGHILKCRTVPLEQVHPELWKGANRRFKKVPWSKLEAQKLHAPRTREAWDKKVEMEMQKREKKRDKLKAIGYDFEAPALKRVDAVPVGEAPAEIPPAGESAADAETLIEAVQTTAGNAPPAVLEEIEVVKGKAKQGKRPKKSKGGKAVT
ncbi:MAG: hypothetical protein M1838_005879 [Thelocarpon superellum]|nr:MAG: hypothetical protein M1838_005879 [Thelocarpon superellum]